MFLKFIKNYLITKKFKQIQKEKLKEFNKLNLKPFNGNIPEYFKMIYIEIKSVGDLMNDCLKRENGFESFTLEEQFIFLAKGLMRQLDELSCIRYEYEYRHQKEFRNERILKECIKVVELLDDVYFALRHNTDILAKKIITKN